MKKIILSLLFVSAFSYSQVKKAIKPNGYYIMENANCAGIKFNSNSSASLISEFSCISMDLSIKWIDEKTFFLKEISDDKTCPPRLYFYKIISLVNDVLKLKEFDTSWGVNSDEVVILKKYKNE